jgi:hypothetical protein
MSVFRKILKYLFSKQKELTCPHCKKRDLYYIDKEKPNKNEEYKKCTYCKNIFLYEIKMCNDCIIIFATTHSHKLCEACYVQKRLNETNCKKCDLLIITGDRKNLRSRLCIHCEPPIDEKIE